MAWALVVVAGALEVAFALSLGASEGFTRPAPSAGTVLFGTLAVWVLSRALRDVPLSTGYAAFTAIGAIGTATIAMAGSREPVTGPRLAALALVVAGVVALRLTSGTTA